MVHILLMLFVLLVGVLIGFVIGVVVVARKSVEAEERARRAERKVRELEGETYPFPSAFLRAE
jgi:F0F1-type ATP synthase assembly protein I